jgi:hypothetical protein
MRVRPNEIKRKRRTDITKFDINWNAKYSELKLFKERFNHCDVPQQWKENPSLGSWVIRQRTYKEYLSPDRITQLDKLGFKWSLYDYLWNKQYNELKKYKKEFGNCEVSKGKGQYEKLGEWVGKQRMDYKHKFPRMTPEKIEKLNAIGFRWSIPNTPWQERLKELAAFKARYGHCRVPHQWSDNPPLAAWVSIQRREYKNNKLKPERIQQLEELGFTWKIEPRKYFIKNQL